MDIKITEIYPHRALWLRRFKVVTIDRFTRDIDITKKSMSYSSAEFLARTFNPNPRIIRFDLEIREV